MLCYLLIYFWFHWKCFTKKRMTEFGAWTINVFTCRIMTAGKVSAYLVVSGTRAGRVEVWVSLYSDVQVNVRADTQHTPLCQHSTHNTPPPVWVCQRWAGQWLTYFLINPKSVSPERGQATVLSKIWIVGIIRDTGPVSYFLLSTSELGVTWPPVPEPGAVSHSYLFHAWFSWGWQKWDD